MTTRPPRPCSVYPCPDLATYRGRCARHAGEAEADRNDARAESVAVYRSATWRRVRRRVLLERPWCEWPACRNAATDVDHVVTIGDGGDPYDEANLRPLCHAHHSTKTATEDRTRRY